MFCDSRRTDNPADALIDSLAGCPTATRHLPSQEYMPFTSYIQHINGDKNFVGECSIFMMTILGGPRHLPRD